MKRQIIRTALLAWCAGNLVSAAMIGDSQAEFRQRFALNPNGRVAIHNLYGDVAIAVWDEKAVLVEAVKHTAGAGAAEGAQVVVERTADSVSIRTEYSGADPDRPASVEYRITVPRGANLENVKIVNGGLSIDGLAGPVRANAVNGSIRAQGLGGQADLSTVNGRLEAEFEKISPANPISLSSVNGSIRLTIPPTSDVGLTAQNLSGGIISYRGRATRTPSGQRLVVKGCGTQIRLHNVNGGISIRANERHVT